MSSEVQTVYFDGSETGGRRITTTRLHNSSSPFPCCFAVSAYNGIGDNITIFVGNVFIPLDFSSARSTGLCMEYVFSRLDNQQQRRFVFRQGHRGEDIRIFQRVQPAEIFYCPGN